MRPNIIRIICSCSLCFLLNSCSHLIFEECNKTKQLTQEAIFLYLLQPEENIFNQIFIGKGLIKIDPELCQRKSLITNGKVYFEDQMSSDMLKNHFSKSIYRLVIPDSLRDKYEYVGFDKDFEHDYAIIHQFSPLLPTIEPNIYLMEHYSWTNACGINDDITCVRVLDREFLKFKIQKFIC